MLVPAGGAPAAQEEPVAAEAISQPSEPKSERDRRMDGEKPLQFEDYEMLVGPDGKPVPVRKDATLKEFLKFLESKNKPVVQDTEPYDIGSITIEGTVDDRLARLVVTFEVHVNEAQRVVSVPLDLREAVLTDIEHSGAGEARPDESNDRDSGYRWWFRGRGDHTLKLSLLIGIRKLVGARRLQLSLPPSAVGTLKLEIPRQGLKLSTPDDAILISKETEDSTQIELFGLGQRLDLQWQPLPDRKSVRTVLQADTSIEVEVMKESVVLQANQRLRATPGSFEEITVKLPEGFDIRDVGGQLYSNHRDDPNAPNHVIVQLTEEAVDETELWWTLEKENPGTELTLDGFSVNGARQQTGEITIKTTGGYRINNLESDAVLRKSVDPGDEQTAAVAYRFLRQPFRLVLGIEEIEPRYTVEPRMLLRFSEKTIKLDAKYRFDVMADRGVVREVELLWPGLIDEAWEIEPSQFQARIERREIDRSAGRIRYILAQPTTGTFEIELRAQRDIEQQDESIALNLPVASATRTLPTILAVAQDDNVDAALSPGARTEMRAQTSEENGGLDLPEEWQSERLSALQIASGSHEFFAAVMVHDRSVTATAAVSVEMQDGQLVVTQRTTYDVEYGRLSEVRLQVPEELVKRTLYFMSTPDEAAVGQETALMPGEPIGIGALKETRLGLPEARIGQFDIVTQFTIDRPEALAPGEESSIAIPLIQPTETALAAVRLLFRGPNRVEAEVTGDGWQRQLTPQGAETWTSPAAVAEIPLVLTYPTRPVSQSYTVPKAVIRTWVDESGSIRSRSQFRLDGSVASIELLVPEELTIDEFWWDDTRLGDASELLVSADSGSLLLPITENPERGSHLLTVESHSTTSPSSWSARHELAAVQLGGDTWINQSVWKVALPFDQHLLTYPEGYTPLFQWRRSSLLWGRATLPQYSDLDRWISVERQPPLPFDQGQANTYVFGRIGPPQPLVFRSMQLSVLVLVGAGAAWVAGVLLLRVPASRQTLSLLTIALCLAILSLWYAAQMQLLIQPAALGAVLALAAVLIDGYFKRAKPTTILSVSSPSDFVTSPSSSSSVERVMAINMEPGEPASTRSRPSRPAEPVSSTDSGSHL